MAKGESIRKIHDAIDEHFPDHLERRREFLRQKSVSATGEGIKETARIVRDFILEFGGAAEYRGEGSFPIVHGRVDSGNPKTLIIYGGIFFRIPDR